MEDIKELLLVISDEVSEVLWFIEKLAEIIVLSAMEAYFEKISISFIVCLSKSSFSLDCVFFFLGGGSSLMGFYMHLDSL